MAQLRSNTADQAPPLLIIGGSLAILFHLGTVIIHALAAPSGPWPSPDGMSMAGPPSFAQALDEPLVQSYLKPLKLTHNYHFGGNRPIAPGVSLEVRLKDAKGELLTTVRFPDPQANAWVRYQQGLFAQGFVPDQPIVPPAGEAIPAPNQQVRMVPIWDLAGEQSLHLRRVAEHLIPRDRQVYGPTQWSLVLVHSYARYLCRTHKAASAEVVRHSRETIPPTALLMGNLPPAAFTDLLANYGDTSGD
jgi:hypothetical protein